MTGRETAIMMNAIVDILNSDARRCVLEQAGVSFEEAVFSREDLTEFHGLLLCRLVFSAGGNRYTCYVNAQDNSLADMTWTPIGA